MHETKTSTQTFIKSKSVNVFRVLFEKFSFNYILVRVYFFFFCCYYFSCLQKPTMTSTDYKRKKASASRIRIFVILLKKQEASTTLVNFLFERIPVITMWSRYILFCCHTSLELLLRYTEFLERVRRNSYTSRFAFSSFNFPHLPPGYCVFIVL